MKPYSIYLPTYDHTSGGIKVMYALYGALLAKGQIVIPNVTFQNDFIAIYPEIVNGNPLRGTTVVRYLLNEPGVMSGNGQPSPTSFPDTDIQYSFSKLFTPDFTEDRIMFLPAIDTNTFYDQKKKREHNAVFIGKGTDTRKHPNGCWLIDRGVAFNQNELADQLNECQYLYTYDPVSAMSEIARLCGCKVVYLGEKYTKDDYLRYEPGINGMSFDGEPTDLDSEAFTRHYKDLYAQFMTKIDSFITTTQNENI
jgi:hypothetical protein